MPHEALLPGRGRRVMVIETGSRARRFTMWSSERGCIELLVTTAGGLRTVSLDPAVPPPRARVAAPPVVLARIVATAGGVVYAA
ncbi:MAG: hypothetical protein K2X56_08725 [Mycobacterium pseudokansasii]|uniref:Uncharacterized protein n=1 Tax=Mycobacterium pseudokansasii TaxID=2341080 RepID=A0A498QQM4_9MYCO|nr:hypothetical protein [Mycobacterium pseudokansasii]MBY0388169.1 hypothetical protein [Mycobacterium pseudokansasii]VBA52118.1 hypothetical protein LAUMK142_03389 [Mycobacterium pseudokansasii]